MTRVLVTAELTPDRSAVLDEALRGRADLLAADPLPPRGDPRLEGVEVLLCAGFPREFPEDLAERLPRLRLIQTLLAGVDHLPFERIPADVTVCSNAGAYDAVLAEHAWALLLAAAKNVVTHTEAIRQGTFRQDRPSKGLEGALLGVLGLGGIGRRVAAIGRAWGMAVQAINRRGAAEEPWAFVGTLDDLEHVLRRSDFVVVALPLTTATYGLIDATALGWMKADAVLVNVARGKILDEEALYRHLVAHPRFQAALDVWWRYPRGGGRPFTRPFHTLPNVVMTPHIAWNVPAQRRRSMEHAVRNVLRYVEGKSLENVVDRREYEGLP